MTEGIRTTGDLIAALREIDPEGTMQIGLSGNGSQVRRIDGVEADTLHVNGKDPTFATRGRHLQGIMVELCDVQKGRAVFID